MIASIMKLDNVTQWVRGFMLQVPPAQSLASRAVVNLTCIVGNGGCEAERNKSAGRITESRNLYTCGPFWMTSMGKESRRLATVWKAEVL
jgi:hypothetical protein